MFGNLFHFLKKSTDVSADADDMPNYIDISADLDNNDTITAHEKILLTNILKLRDISVVDVMVPRADIIAADASSSCDELLGLLSERQISRLPIYEDNLDNVLGSLHIKDILASFADHSTKGLNAREHLTDIPIVSPAMPVLDLILEMRQSRRHMVLVVDEYGGIDGLVTLSDIIEAIVGEVDDEHDDEGDEPQMVQDEDGSLLCDGRIDIEDFEARHGCHLANDERDEIETLGGLVFTIAGRIPRRGEVLTHKSGMVFEILEADPRRIHKMRIRNIPAAKV